MHGHYEVIVVVSDTYGHYEVISIVFSDVYLLLLHFPFEYPLVLRKVVGLG